MLKWILFSITLQQADGVSGRKVKGNDASYGNQI
jgi:hypothetical protein